MTATTDALTTDALAALRSWTPPSPDQARLRDEYVDHLIAHPDGVRRECRPDHLTAGTVVLSPDGEQVLLNLHRKAREWFAFGGHCEPGDQTLAAVALREAREESGLADLDFDPVPIHLSDHAVPFCHPSGVVRHLDVRYAARAAGSTTPEVSDESLELAWFALTDLADLTPALKPDMIELIDRARARLRPATG